MDDYNVQGNSYEEVKRWFCGRKVKAFMLSVEVVFWGCKGYAMSDVVLGCLVAIAIVVAVGTLVVVVFAAAIFIERVVYDLHRH